MTRGFPERSARRPLRRCLAAARTATLQKSFKHSKPAVTAMNAENSCWHADRTAPVPNGSHFPHLPSHSRGLKSLTALSK